MWNIRYRAALLAVFIALGCPFAEAGQRHADAAGDDLPRQVVAAAGRAVPGLRITDGKRRARRKEVVYRIKGVAADGRRYTLTVAESGRVLQITPSKKKAAKAEAVPDDSPFRRIGSIQYPAIRESSGIISSRRQANVLWTHNDKGNAPQLYAITKEGRLLARFTLPADNQDWEDIDIDDQGRLYIGSIGNNDASGRGPIEVFRVAEPDVSKAADTRRSLQIERTWRLRYPAEPFDCEALFVHGPHGYLISKHLNGAAAALYRFDLAGSADQTLTALPELPIHEPVTGASLSPDGARLAVLTYGKLYLFDHGGDIARAGQVKPVVTPTPAGKLEGVCFIPEGILLTAESRQIYLLREPRTSTVSIDKDAAP